MVKDTNRGHVHRIVVGTVLIILLLAGGAGALSNDGGGSWSYYKEITISNTGAALSDYQVLVNLSGAGFPLNANKSGADVRFSDAGGKELAYWVESWDYANKSAKVWVNVMSVPAGASTIRMWYGNAKAMSASNGTTTFYLFDDFSGTTVDTARWSTSGVGDISQSGGFLNVAYSRPWYQGSYSLIKSNTVFNIPFRFGMKIKDSGGINDVYKSAGVGQPTNGNYDNGGNNRVNLRRQWNGNFYDTIKDGSIESNLLSTTMDANTWYTYLFSASPSQVDFYNGTTHQSQTANIPNTSTPLSIYVKQWTGDNGGSATISVDYIFLAKYASPDPLVSVGAEQNTGVPSISIIPKIQNVSTGQNFTLNITVAPSNTPVFSAEFILKFDPAKLEALNITQGKFLSQDGASTMVIVKKIDNALGEITYGETRVGVNTGVTSQGTLASAAFRVKSDAAQGISYLNFTKAQLSDAQAEPIPNITTNNGSVNIIANQPPVAVITKPWNAKVIRGEKPETFDASASYDVDGNIVSYKWDFGDGNSSISKLVTYQYTSYKYYDGGYHPFNLTLTVTDDKSASSSVTQSITPILPGDANLDGKVDILDAALVGLNWGRKVLAILLPIVTPTVGIPPLP